MNSKRPKVMAISALLAALRHHDRHRGTAARALAILQYAVLARALVALVGFAVMYATDR